MPIPVLGETMSWKETVFKRVKHEPFDGRPPIQYRIQLVDESLIDETVSFMAEHFFHRENLRTSIDERFGKLGFESTNKITKYLSEGISLAAVLEDDQGNKGALIGCNVLIPKQKDDSKKRNSTKGVHAEANNQRQKIFIQTLDDLKAKADIFTLYNCSSYIYATGLGVAPDFEGRGIGVELLRARGEVCRMTNTPVSATIFSGAAAQHIAAKCGFETLAELDLTSYRIDGQIVYPKPKSPVIKWMAMRYF